MKTGERWSCRKSSINWLGLLLPMLLWHVTGCATDRASPETLLAVRDSTLRNEGVVECYRVGCPDILELHIPKRPELSKQYEIGPDGNIDLEDYGKLRTEGKTLPEIAKTMAAETGMAAENVQVRVAEFRHSHVILFGEVAGLQRSISYHGPETVLDLLYRSGGFTVGAAPKDVYIVRPHLGDSQRPELFHVDLHAIVLKHDNKTNVRVLPYDQIYVGETRRSKVEKALPPWLRLAYQAIWDTRPKTPPDTRGKEQSPSTWVVGKKAATGE